jgi:hypothetical protein
MVRSTSLISRALASLAQGPRVGGHRQGLELTQLRLKASAILAEAFMLAMTQAAMFHVAAAEHFVDRDDLEDGLAPGLSRVSGRWSAAEGH